MINRTAINTINQHQSLQSLQSFIQSINLLMQNALD